MSERGTNGFADGIATGLVLAAFSGVLFLCNLLTTLLVRVYIKYRRQRMVLYTAGVWVVSIGIAAIIASMPGLLTTGIVLGLAATTGCAIALAVIEIVLDQQALHSSGADDESVVSHLRSWWS